MNKAELRKIYNSKRAALSQVQVESDSQKICDNVFRQFNFKNISSVHIFLPIKNKKEINTNYFIGRLQKEYPHINIVIPKIRESFIDSFLLGKDTILKENSLGIPEPENGIPFINHDLDFVFLPLLAFDQNGNRIGYGKGFYDRFLSTCKPNVIKAGLSFFEAEDQIESEVFDVPLNFCVTPLKVYSF